MLIEAALTLFQIILANSRAGEGQLEKELFEIKQFWNEQAKINKGTSLATSPDTIAFEMELEQMKHLMPSGCCVLDVGCGNGIKGIELAKELEINYYGMDYSEEMIKQATQLLANQTGFLKGTIEFFNADILDATVLKPNYYDIVISDRCLINLKTLDNQVLAAKNIHSALKSNGIYLMFENSMQSLDKLNKVRRQFSLPDIEVRWHNLYIDENLFFNAVKDYFNLVKINNFASTYYLISRTINAILTPTGEKINYLSDINKLSAKLPALGDYSPLKLFILKKV